MRRLHLVAGFAILAVWCAAVTDGMITGDYHGLDAVTPVMLILAGYLFGDALLRRRGGNGDDNHR